jgi:outer membrane lipoprotein SlyB
MASRIALSLISLVALTLTGCGNSHLTSVTITPATADAKNFPHGLVQFTATGKPVPLTNVHWCVGSANGFCNGNVASAATVDGNGLASCTGAPTGTSIILAGTTNSMGMPDQGGQLSIFGTAKLTCP